MADIIPFTPPERRGEAPRGGVAEIVIFPGVRYERTEETDGDEPQRRERPGGRKRRKLS